MVVVFDGSEQEFWSKMKEIVWEVINEAKCELVCRHSSKVVASAIVQSRKSVSQPQTF
jgi:hypothetical protein